MKKRKNDKRKRIRTIERKFGVDLGYGDDEEMYRALTKAGFPSLVKLLKMK